MRLIDADALKEYCKEGLIEVLPRFKTDKYKDLAIQVTAGFCRDIDEQPTVQAIPIEVPDKIRAEISKLQIYKLFEDTEKLVALDEVLQIIDKYNAESEV